jgi:acetylornithine/succinyldiaminopimelate/putrescine aminotransferase
VSCAAGLASLKLLLERDLIQQSATREALFRELLVHPAIREIRGRGLYMAVELGDPEKINRFMKLSIENGIVSDSFLFHNTAFRISPPLIITPGQIREVCSKLIGLMDQLG